MTSAPSHEQRIRDLPIWRGLVQIAPLTGGITNTNYWVKDLDGVRVVRIGEDIPIHGIMRFNELAASQAAAAAGISPRVLHAASGVLVIEMLEGRTYAAEDVRADLGRVIALLKRVHREIPLYLRGPVLAFDVFHILNDYAHRLRDDGSRMCCELPRFLAAAKRLRDSIGPDETVFGHNDLLPANFIADDRRLWLIDWDYAGFGSPLFDLGGLASNNQFNALERRTLLETYFEKPADDALERRFRAMTAASLLREAMWSMVSEIHSAIDFDYPKYTAENLSRFEAAWSAFLETE